MTRRVYYTDEKKRRQRQDLMLNYRKARRAIDPGLLDGARNMIIEAIENAQEKIRQKERAGKPSEMIPIDRKRNLSIVMKYLEMNPDNRAARNEILLLLKEDL